MTHPSCRTPAELAAMVFPPEESMSLGQLIRWQNLQRSVQVFDAARILAEQYGMTLTAMTGTHYQLRHRSGWIVNLYPSSQKIYVDPHHDNAPYIEDYLPDSWDVLMLVSIMVGLLARQRRRAARRQQEAAQQAKPAPIQPQKPVSSAYELVQSRRRCGVWV